MMVVIEAILLFALATGVNSHAYLNYPASSPACGQGSGRTPGVCGDPFQNAAGNPAYIPFVNRFFGYTTLGQGQELDVEISVSTNHGGRMWLSVCPFSKDQVTQECFNNMNHRLRRVDSNPEYNNKIYWYLNPGNSVSAVAKYKLPADISCDDGCMMQWWWQGYQTCVSPCEDASIDVPSECGKNLINPTVPACEAGQTQETFANCADVIIRSGGDAVSRSEPQAVPLGSNTTTYTNSTATNSSTQATESQQPNNTVYVQSAQTTAANTEQGTQPGLVLETDNSNSTAVALMSDTDASCDMSQSWCRQCCQTAATTRSGPHRVAYCSACGQSTGSNKCLDCMRVSRSDEVENGCLDCVTSDPDLAWACTNTCAAKARNAQQMQMCRVCIKTPGMDLRHCRACMAKSCGRTARVTACTSCIICGRDPRSCTRCLSKGSQEEIDACYACLDSASDPSQCGV